MDTRTLNDFAQTVLDAKEAFSSALASCHRDHNRNAEWADDLNERQADDSLFGTPGLVCWWDQHPFHDESETGSVFYAAYVDLEDTLVCAFWHPAVGEWEPA